MDSFKKLLIISTMLFIAFIAITFTIPKIRRFIINEVFDYYFNIFGFVAIFLASFLVVCMIIFPLLSKVSFVSSSYKGNEISETETEICSLYLNNNIETKSDNPESSFAVGINNINTESYFYFFIKENNKYKLEKINTDNVYLIETDETSPKIVYTEKKEVSTAVHKPTKFGKLIGLKKEEYKNTISQTTEHTIYIPVGSVIKEYNPNPN